MRVEDKDRRAMFTTQSVLITVLYSAFASLGLHLVDAIGDSIQCEKPWAKISLTPGLFRSKANGRTYGRTTVLLELRGCI